jgi:hypothetical protein
MKTSPAVLHLRERIQPRYQRVIQAVFDYEAGSTRHYSVVVELEGNRFRFGVALWTDSDYAVHATCGCVYGGDQGLKCEHIRAAVNLELQANGRRSLSQ